MACGISTPLSPGYTETSGILVAIQTTSPSLGSQQEPPASTSRCCIKNKVYNLNDRVFNVFTLNLTATDLHKSVIY